MIEIRLIHTTISSKVDNEMVLILRMKIFIYNMEFYMHHTLDHTLDHTAQG